MALYRVETIEKWQGEKSFEGLEIGWVRGYDYDKYLSVNVKKQEMNSRENGLKLLRTERIAAFLDDKQDLADTLKDNKSFLGSEYVQKIVMQLKLYPAFSDTKRGRELMKIWDT